MYRKFFSQTAKKVPQETPAELSPYAVTFICIFTVLLPTFAVMTAVPFAFAVILPFEVTDATEDFELDHSAVPAFPSERTAPSWSVEPFFRVAER